jgi:hypothetical protein
MAFDGKKFVREMMARPARITAYMTREVDDDAKTRIWKEWSLEPRDGWIVGATWLQTGVRHAGSPGGFAGFLGQYEEDSEPSTFEETAPRRLVYLVAPWPTLTPLKVPPEHVKLVDPSEFDPSCWDAAGRELAVGWSREYPRDGKGRWKSTMPPPNPRAIPRKCEHCGCDLAHYLGELEEHRGDCPNFPL